MKITIPDSWDEVPLGKLIEINNLDPKSRDYGLNIISILTDKDTEEIRKLSKESFDTVLRHLEWAMKSPEEKRYNQIIDIDGVSYNLIENLNGFSGGEWWDMEEYLSDFNNNLHNIMAMLYRLVDEKEYNSKLCMKRGDLFFDKMPIGKCYGALVFFSIVEKTSTVFIQDYLMNQNLRAIKKQRKSVKKD